MSRLNRLRTAARAAEIDLIALMPGANLRYLLNLDFHLSERLTLALIPVDGPAAMVLPQMEARRVAASSSTALTLYPWSDEHGPHAALGQCLAELELQRARLGVEYTTMRVQELRSLEQAAPMLQISDAGPVLMQLRAVKDSQEVDLMRQAVRIVETGLAAAIAAIRPGVTERQLARIWEQAMADAGGAGPSFATLVASGPHSADPHHGTSDRPLAAGELILLDGGAWYQGYASDITRTVALGEPGQTARTIYELVRQANAAGRAAARAGVSGEAVDSATRAVISAGGYGPQFLHRTGHGLGLEIHEPPYLVQGNQHPLQIGNTFTIEPGIYLAGLGGVRIEDDLLINAEGAESLTSFARELLVVPVQDHAD